MTPAKWLCPKCQHLNHAGAAKCGGCEGEAASAKSDDAVYAAGAHAESEGDNGNAEISFLAGADWATARERAKSKALLDALKDAKHSLQFPDELAWGKGSIEMIDKAISDYEGEA